MNKNYYLFRINYDECYDLIRREAMEGRLRQGWSGEGLDIRDETEFDRNINKGIKFKNSLKKMLNFENGDIIVVPKINIDNKSENPWQSFTIFEVTKKYDFQPINVSWGEDFGSIIGVKPIVSYNYCDNAQSEMVSKSFRYYRYPVNNIYMDEVIEAIVGLISEKDNKIIIKNEIDKISYITLKDKKKYLEEIINSINKVESPQYFENLIKELFEKQGYVYAGRNKHDNKGGDVDLLFNIVNKESFLYDCIEFNDEYTYEVPQIWIQAKKKTGCDYDHEEAVKQLILQTNSSEINHVNINIVISLVGEFKKETKKIASENNIILINGLQFASLLVKYGIKV